MILRQLLSLIAVSVVSVFSAGALNIDITEAGTLKNSLENPENVTELKVTGTIDAADLFFIGQELDGLQSVDLGQASIEAYKGPRLYGHTSYAANTIPSGSFAGSPVKTVTLPEVQGLVISDAAFMSSGVTSMTFPAGLDSIGSSAFAGCNALTEVTLPACRMGTAVFADCEGLKTVNAANVTAIAPSSFKGCTALTTVTGTASLVEIGSRAFEGDKALTTFAFGKNLKEIGHSAFASTGLTEADLAQAKSLTAISEQTFADSNLTSVSLPDNVTEIGHSAFFGNTNLATLVLPAGTIAIGDHALNATRLTELELPAQLEEIGDYALMGQTEIRELKLPATLISIGSHAMEGMTGLSRIDALALTSVPELGEDVWEGVNQPGVTLSVHEDYAPDFKNADQWKEFTFDVTTGVTDIENNAPESTGVKGRFAGTDLLIESNGPSIDVVRMFDIAGRLVLAVEPRDTSITIDTADIQGNIFIVNITLENKATATLKLGRR